ncbi:helix-turn-helix domain-containing protein [Pseudomonas monteilii]|uniref:transcriptional regulator n=1 Tax=Pseudomonas monteilii TaxID=76759 RepID=UPI0018E68604|nr:YdaS family helix-turn-helix protein [Pseudomonas monteilii]MBI6917688.1 helix-turn-helix domain-containing protein [Pseudomonas monteilii]
MRIKNTQMLDWLKAASDEAIARTGTTRGYLKQIAYGNKQASAMVAANLERETQGLITRQSLRPDDWQAIWPELSTVRLRTKRIIHQLANRQ